MIYTIKEQEKYYFEFGGNMDKPEKERGFAIIEFPSMLELNKAFVEYNNDAEAEFMCYVKSINNFKLKEGGKDVTPLEVYETPGLYGLAVELKNRYLKYAAIDKKKLNTEST